MRDHFRKELTTKQFEYTEKSGRLWTPFQNVKKEYKRAVLAESGFIYEYDVDSCAPTLILQYAQQFGLKRAKTIQFYLNNKQEVRDRISEAVEIPIKDAKQIINALFSGAQIDKSIGRTLKNDKSRIEWFKQDEFIINLKKDISKCWQYIKKGLKFDKSQRLTSRIKWGIYFSLERQILDVSRKYLGESNQCILEHDGWTCANQINQNELLRLIKDQTGFSITLSEMIIDNASMVPCI